jgi:HAD superfamily hydrolase (TIGR01490 family)
VKEAKMVEETRKAKEVMGKCRGVAAFFDLDGTLVARPSLERRFFRMLQYRRGIAAKNYWRWLLEAVRLAPRGLRAALHGNKMYLQGVAADRLGKGGLNPAPTFFGPGLGRVAWHARQGHTIAIVSGTLEPLAKEAALAIEGELRAIGALSGIRVCATRLEEIDGRWTGRVWGEPMFGEAKARAAKRLAEEMGLDLGRCYAYGDSLQDRWLMEAVGRPVAVNPSNDLAAIAGKHGWPVQNWKGEENPGQRRRVPGGIALSKEHPGVVA